MFFELLKTSFAGVAEVIAGGVVATLVIAGRRPRQSYLDVLNMLFVRLTLPCLVFVNLATNFRPGRVPYWWVYPLLSPLLFFFGGLTGRLYALLDRRIDNTAIFTVSTAFHNSMLLPLAIGPVIFTGERLDTFLNLLFLNNILAVPAFFTIGVWMVNSSAGVRLRIHQLLTPPTIATFLGLVVGWFGVDGFIPGPVMRTVSILGSMTRALSILVVGGAVVSSFAVFRAGEWGTPLKITLVKSLVYPVMVTTVVVLLRPEPMIALFAVLGSAMPVGSTIAAVIPPDDRIRKTVAGAILMTSAVAVIVVPVVLSVYGVVFGW